MQFVNLCKEQSKGLSPEALSSGKAVPHLLLLLPPCCSSHLYGEHALTYQGISHESSSMPLTWELTILAVLLVAVEETPTLPALWSKDLVFKK